MNSARPVILEGDVLTLEFSEQMWVDRFKENPASGKAVFEDLREAILGALGVRLRFVPRLGTMTGAGPTTPAVPVSATLIELSAAIERLADNPDDDAPTTKMEPVESPELVAPAPAEAEPVEAEPTVAEPAERRGESVIREMLGATLIANIDDASTPHARTATFDDSPAIFDIDPTPRQGDE